MNARRIFAKTLAPALLAAGLTGVTGAAVMTAAGPAAADCGQGNPVKSYARTRPVQELGDHGVWTYAVQVYLNHAGRHVRPTGTFNRTTVRVVKSYQRHHHIKPSGVVGRRTWVSMIGAAPSDVVWPGAVNHIPDFAIDPGDDNQDHLDTFYNVLQRVLVGKELDKVVTQWENDSAYDGATLAAVKRFQRDVGIKPSGIVGTKTWTKLYETVSATAGWGC